jgi:predicted Zn-dependent protease
VNGVVASVSREIRLYRFANASDLRVLAAHEFGHALGLGHTQDPTGVMNASARADQPVDVLASTDVALFRTVCPAI